MLKKTLKGGFAPPALSILSQFELLSVALAPSQSETAVGGVTCQWQGKKPRRSRPPGGMLAALTRRDMSSSLSHEVPRGAQDNLWPSPGKLLRRVLSEERGECCSPPPNCDCSRATPRGASPPLNCRRSHVYFEIIAATITRVRI